MNPNPLNHMLVNAHRDDLLRDAEAQRLANEVEASSTSNALLASLGRQMVKLGEQLTQENVNQPRRELQPER